MGIPKYRRAGETARAETALAETARAETAHRPLLGPFFSTDTPACSAFAGRKNLSLIWHLVTLTRTRQSLPTGHTLTKPTLTAGACPQDGIVFFLSKTVNRRPVGSEKL